MWPTHALGRPILGYTDTLASFTRDDLFDFVKRYYQPANISIVVAGKHSRDKLISFVKNIFSMDSAKKKITSEAVRKKQKESHTEVSFKKTKQTHAAIGFHSLRRSHKLKYAMNLLNIILGGNMSSRLFDRLREKKGLCYEISSSTKKYNETGAFIIHAGVDNKKFQEATKEIICEIRDLKKKCVTDDELNRAKEYSRGQFLLALEDTGARMLWLGDHIMAEGKAPSAKEIFRNIDKVTKDDIRKVANVIFKNNNMSLAAIGPVNQNEKKELRKILNL